MPRRLVGALTLALAAPAVASDPAAGLAACRGILEAGERLACYDALSADRTVLEFAGRGGGLSPKFDIVAPTRLRYESADIVMVLYLLDAAGAVVRNLHQPGVGEGSFLIEHPGGYQVQVNATGDWRIWLTPP